MGKQICQKKQQVKWLHVDMHAYVFIWLWNDSFSSCNKKLLWTEVMSWYDWQIQFSAILSAQAASCASSGCSRMFGGYVGN